MTQTPPPPPAPQYDPKAQAAAAKAYAKAQRPWFKKKRFIIPGVIVLLIIIGSAASSGGGEKGTQNNPPTSGSQKVENGGNGSGQQQPAANTPDNSSKGKGPITWGNWQVVGKLQVTKEDYTNDYSVITRVKNTGDAVDQGFFTVTILKGNDILGTADCSTSDVNPGSVAVATCSSMDSFKPGWTEVTIENAF